MSDAIGVFIILTAWIVSLIKVAKWSVKSDREERWKNLELVFHHAEDGYKSTSRHNVNSAEDFWKVVSDYQAEYGNLSVRYVRGNEVCFTNQESLVFYQEEKLNNARALLKYEQFKNQ